MQQKDMNKSILEQDIIDLVIKRVKMDNKKLCDNIYELMIRSADTTSIDDYTNKIKKIDEELDSLFVQFTKTTNEEILNRLNETVNDLTELKKVYKKELSKITLISKTNITKKIL